MKLNALFLAAVATTAFLRADVSETVTQTATLPASNQILVVNPTGSVSITAWSGDTVEVTAVRTAKNQKALERVQVKVEKTDQFLAIKTVQPTDSTASVSYSIKVPAGASFRKIHTVNGAVSVDGVKGDIDISTAQGAITVAAAGGKVLARNINDGITISGTPGQVAVHSVNGPVRLALADVPASASITGSTTKGEITVALPEGVSSSIRAKTKNGAVTSSLALPKAQRGLTGTTLEAQLGSGGGKLEVESVDGSVRFERS